MKTFTPKAIAPNTRPWFVVDAEGKTVGRLATTIADHIRGKNRVDFAPHIDNGGYVIVLNAEKIIFTGNKEEDKLYRTHSGYIGHLKEVPVAKMREVKPTEIIRLAVFGMLPKNKHRDTMILRLKPVVGGEHTFQAQKPTPLSV